MHATFWSVDLPCMHLYSSAWNLWVSAVMMIFASITFKFSNLRILWLTKEALYRDASWESPCTGGSALFLFFGMAVSFWCNIVFLVTGFHIMQILVKETLSYTGGAQCQPSPCQVGAIATLFILGNWLHHSSDVQVTISSSFLFL